MAFKREQVVQTAEKYVARGKIEPAIREYRKLLEENPNDINTLNRVGDLYARIQRIDEAVDFFNQIAEQYASEGFFVKAIAIYKKIIKLDPTRLDVYENLAELYHRQGLVTEARTQYQVLADYYQKHENATSTIAIYQKMADLEPNNPTYHVKLAELYQQQQLIDKAMGEYRIIAELMLAHGHPQEAAQVYERALAIDSTNLAFITDAALKLKEAAGTGITVRFLSAAVERNPQAAQVARMIGGAGAAGFAAGLSGTHSGIVSPAAPPPAPAAAAAAAAPAAGAADGAAGSARAWASDVDLDLEMEIDLDLGSELVVEEEAGPAPPPAQGSASAGEQGPASQLGRAAGYEPAFEVDEETAAGLPEAGMAGGQVARPTQDAGGADLEDVFVLDIEDEEEPASLVKPPPDMLHEPRRPSWAQEAAPAAGAAAAPSGTALPERLPELPELRLTGEFELINPFATFDQPVDIAGGAARPEMARPFRSAGVTPPPPRPPVAAPGLPPAAVPPAGVTAATAATTPGGAAGAPGGPASVPLGAPGVPGPPIGGGRVALHGEYVQSGASPGPGTAPAAGTPPVPVAETRPEGPPAPGPARPPAIKIDSELLERTAAELHPPAVERYEDLVSEAEVLAKYGLEEKAIERLREATRLRPRQFAAYLLLIQLQLDKGRHARVIELANQVSRLSESGDREPWAKLRRRLLAAGYRLDGDRVASGPQLPGVAEGEAAARPARPRTATPGPSSEAAERQPGAAAEASPPAAPGQPPAVAAAPPGAAPARRRKSDTGIEKILRSLVDRPQRSGRAAKKPAAAAAGAPGVAAGPAPAAAAGEPGAAPAGPEQAAAAAIPTPVAAPAPAADAAAAPPAASFPVPMPAQAPPAPAELVAAGAPAEAAAPVPAEAAAPASATPAPHPAAPEEAAPLPAAAATAAAAAPQPPPEPLPESRPGVAPAPARGQLAPLLPLPMAPATPEGTDRHDLAPPAAAAAAPDLVELPPLLTGDEEAVPREELEQPLEVFNPLEIGAMVEREEIDWGDDGASRPGFAPGLAAAGAAGAPPTAAAGAAGAPPEGAAAAASPGGAGDVRTTPAGAPGSPGHPSLPFPPPAPPAAAAKPGAPGLDDTGGMSWLDEAETGKHEAAARAASLFDEEEDFFDLAGELAQELSREPVFQGDEQLIQQEQSLEEIVEGFKRGVAEHLSPTDYDTHFNLGIAYREMGLLDEAIGEFQLSAKDAHYLVSCCSMLGLCFLDKGLPELAIKWYRRGLEAETISEDDTLGLLYDMGCAYLAMGDNAGAYKTFVDAYGINTNYRDVVARIEELGRPH